MGGLGGYATLGYVYIYIIIGMIIIIIIIIIITSSTAQGGGGSHDGNFVLHIKKAANGTVFFCFVASGAY